MIRITLALPTTPVPTALLPASEARLTNEANVLGSSAWHSSLRSWWPHSLRCDVCMFPPRYGLDQQATRLVQT